jgi:hypothetical protein
MAPSALPAGFGRRSHASDGAQPPQGERARPTSRRGSGATAQQRRSLRGIWVPASTVLRLANSGVRPRGYPVGATAERPAGIALAGVGALGIGLQDGDVLTTAAGRPARSPGDVVGAVLASRGAGAKQISGRFWRDGEPWQLVVEQPYLRPQRRRRPGVREPQAPAGAMRVAVATRIRASRRLR